MVGLGMFMTATYRLKQRRKRLTHRAQGSDTFGLFRRCVARLAQERRVALSIKVRRELGGARGGSGRGVVELRLKGCDLTDAVVELLCEGLEQHPAVGKVDVRGNGALTVASVLRLRALAEFQLGLVLGDGLLGRLKGGEACRQIHGLEGKRGGCVRRFKLDGAAGRGPDAAEPISSVEPTLTPPLIPPPASHMVKPYEL